MFAFIEEDIPNPVWFPFISTSSSLRNVKYERLILIEYHKLYLDSIRDCERETIFVWVSPSRVGISGNSAAISAAESLMATF